MAVQDIHVKEHLGIVTSDTSTIKFSFFLTPLSDKVSVRKNDYVIVDHPVLGEVCPILAVVKEISNFEKATGSFAEKAVEMVAACEVIGYVDLRKGEARVLRELLFPPDTGTKVYLPFSEFLNDVFLRDRDGNVCSSALHLGSRQSLVNTRGGEVREFGFFLNGGEFVGQHFLVSGLSGVGKTHVGVVVVEELANKSDVPVVVLDSFGEYFGVGFGGNDDLGKDYPFDFRFSVFARDVEGVRKTLNGVKVRSGSVRSFSVKSVGKKGGVSVGKELEKCIVGGGVTVLCGEGLSFSERKELFSVCAKSLVESRVKGKGEPFVLVVEEAGAVDGEVLGRIASEGRKLGISLCLLTQSTGELGDGLLSRMGVQILGRTVGSGDLECLKNMALEKVADLPRLGVGEFVVNGVTLRRPTKVQIRERYSAKISGQLD